MRVAVRYGAQRRLVADKSTAPLDNTASLVWYDGTVCTADLGVTHFLKVEGGRGGLGRLASPRFPSALIEPNIGRFCIRQFGWQFEGSHSVALPVHGYTQTPGPPRR